MLRLMLLCCTGINVLSITSKFISGINGLYLLTPPAVAILHSPGLVVIESCNSMHLIFKIMNSSSPTHSMSEKKQLQYFVHNFNTFKCIIVISGKERSECNI